jgi:hypothetical protein
MAPSPIFQFINSFVPFAVPTRPLWIDVVLTLLYCTLLYVGPQIQWQTWTSPFQSPQQRRTAAEPLAHPADDRAAEAPDASASASDSDASDSDADPAPFAIPLHPTVEDAADPLHDGAAFDPAGPGEAAARLAAHQQRLREQQQHAAPQPHQPRRLRDPARPIGKKKAASLARRERVRAYHEFVREQADQQRALDASTAAQREEEADKERARRREVERVIAERERERRERERERREEALAKNVRDGERVREAVSRGLGERGMVSVDEVAGEIGRGREWVEGVVRADVVGVGEDGGEAVLTMLSGTGWVVRISEGVMRDVYRSAVAFEGTAAWRVGPKEIGVLIERALGKQRAGS